MLFSIKLVNETRVFQSDGKIFTQQYNKQGLQYIYLKQDCLISSSVYNVTMSSPAFFTRASVAYPTRGNAVCGMHTVRVITAEVHTAVAS